MTLQGGEDVSSHRIGRVTNTEPLLSIVSGPERKGQTLHIRKV